MLNICEWEKLDLICIKTKAGKMYRSIKDCSAWRGPSSHWERPVGSEVWHTGPKPRMDSPMGNQACIVPRPL